VSVAKVVENFVNLNPRAIILILGSTAARIRLYQMSIAAAWSELVRDLKFWGKGMKKWSPLKKE
jgi:hypothetical protein